MCNGLCDVCDVSSAYWFRSDEYTCDYAYICMLMIVGGREKREAANNNKQLAAMTQGFFIPLFFHMHSEHFRIGYWNVRTINANAYSMHRYLWWYGFNFRVAIYFCRSSLSPSLFTSRVIINYDCPVYVFIKIAHEMILIRLQSSSGQTPNYSYHCFSNNSPYLISYRHDGNLLSNWLNK